MGVSSWRRKPTAGLAFTGHTLLAIKRPPASMLRRADDAATRVAMKPLPDGLLQVSPIAPNIQSVRELAEVAESLLGAVGAHDEPLAIALPDLAITTKVLSGRGRARRPELRRELAPALPYALGEARCDFWRGGHGEVLGAAIRDSVARQYEQIVEAVECRPGWVDGVSLAGIPSYPAGRGLEVSVQLYRDHYALAVFLGGELVDARTKLRSPGDVEHVCREVLRVPALYGSESARNGRIDTLHVSGADARSFAAELAGDDAPRSIRVGDDGEERHLQSSLETLLERGNP